ncbi:MAG: hypothetical protein A2832_00480 [Candidatus Zambryskibacteria bacterium RIFCSPHIGHO2_01_FULL_44_22b]|uniref:Response regulatory domain-containing protein n=1 Tax=Candidatus Zambryskibacteria bacterium RIFCSPHIGHO2_01_FULL_44_22b TaxID=1802737 RepID=A0A1G2SXL0_9BACT|nr:MAG: hypothetical protein A2832_00480 [Candidatus Zambryskibacteria bacterium RIFCSPHIGHO2_01_FULL_44_22b]
MEKHTVLIVDDDKFLLEMYKRKFETNGVQADVAVGAEETLSKLRGGAEPEVLILDIIMPGMNGLELLEVIRKEKLAPKATVIMLTNESGGETINKAKALGIQGYIVKATSVPSEVVEKVWEIANLKKN